MPILNYSLEKGEPKRLSIIWNISNLSVVLDDVEIMDTSATIPELSSGYELTLPDNSLLKIQLVKNFLHVSRNGIPLPNSPADPYRKIKNAYLATFVLGGLYILIGIALFAYVNTMIFTAIFGAVFIILGFLIKRESLWALIIAVIAQVLFNTLPNLLNITAVFAGGFSSMFSFVFRLYLLSQMIIGIGALKSISTSRQKLARKPNTHPPAGNASR